ncbi:hypothetical protein DIPPA_15722 [Diplonema papillatum]|nr:hypothetical protein DIPPA_15722 [Diplonema papillatum]
MSPASGGAPSRPAAAVFLHRPARWAPPSLPRRRRAPEAHLLQGPRRLRRCGCFGGSGDRDFDLVCDLTSFSSFALASSGRCPSCSTGCGFPAFPPFFPFFPPFPAFGGGACEACGMLAPEANLLH